MHDQRRLPLTTSRTRVWQDTAAESLLGGAVGLIALTAINPLVLAANQWLADVVPGIDPVVTMLALVVILTAGLVLGGIGLKVQARRVAIQRTQFARADVPTASSARAEA